MTRNVPRRRYVVSRSGRLAAAAVSIGLAAAAVNWIGGALGSGGQPSRESVLRSVSIQWPEQGQAALAVLGMGSRSSGGNRYPVPIASLAKVMTAYVVLHHDPIDADDDGFTLTITAAEAETSAVVAGEGQSAIKVQPGEELTERQALEALLLPSANNIATALAQRVSGSTSEFVRAMNTEAQSLRMRHTVYTDPSGFDPSTASTASDQLRLAKAAMRSRQFADIIRLQQAVLPVTGVVVNTDSLLGRDGFVGIKTGSESAAGGCFMFESVHRVHHHRITVIGVVLGQRDGPLIASALDAAQRLVDGVDSQLHVTSPTR